MKMNIVYMYLFCILPNCCGIKVPGLNKIKYSFSKSGSDKEVLNENPVYFVLSHKESGSPIGGNDENGTEAYVPAEVNVVNHNNYNDVLSSLKSKVFKKKQTVIHFRDELNVDDKNTKKENRVDESILKLAEIVLLVDRVIVPVDYLKLVKRGCAGMEELKLLGLMTYALNTHTRIYPKMHIVIYNYRPMGRIIHINKKQKEFIERQKYEINEAINEFLNSFVKIVDNEEVNELLFEGISVRCNYVEKYKDLRDLMKQFYSEDHCYYKTCMEDIDDEFNKKLTVCESIDKSAEKSKSLKQLSFNFGDYNELESNFELYEQILNLYKDSFNRFYNVLKGILEDRVEVEKLRTRVNQLVSTTMNEYDASVKAGSYINSQLATKLSSEMRVRLYNKMRSELYKLNHGLLIQLLNKSDKDHQEDIKKLSITETIENDLSSLISKYDSNYCNVMNKIKYEILKNYKPYDSLTQSLRMELAYGLKEYSNRIMGEVIKRGIYYYKFSALDGIRLLPSQKVVGFIKKILNIISLPSNLRISYLSPSAFGLSNLFKSQRKLGPSTCWYFTGKKADK